MACKGIDNVLVAILVTSRIQIHTCNACIRKKRGDLVFNLLSTYTIISPLASACRANRRYTYRVSAIVADQ